MAGRGRKDADHALAAALASGQTLRDAAAEVGLSERTAARRAADAKFRRLVSRLRTEMIQQALGRLASNTTEAADTLKALLKAASENVRLNAAKALLDLATRISDSVDLSDKIEELKQILLGRKSDEDPGDPENRVQAAGEAGRSDDNDQPPGCAALAG